MLPNPEDYGFKLGVWYAINRPDGLAAVDDQHTIHRRLDLSLEEFNERLKELGLFGAREATWHSKSAALNDKLDAMIARSREKRKEENIKE